MIPQPDWLANQARSNPQGWALFAGEVQWTYAQLNQQVTQWSARLQQAGIRPSQRVGVLLPNCVEYICLIHALARLGAVLIPLNLRLSHFELTTQLTQAYCEVLICNREIQAALKNTNTCRQLNLDELRSLNVNKAYHNQHTPLDLNRLHCIVFTSGTSGQAKGVRLSYANHFYSALGSAFRLGMLPQDRWLLCMPLYHVGGLAIVWRCCLYGIALVLQAQDEDLAKIVRTHRVSLLSLVPTLLHRLMADWTKGAPDTVRCILLGGAAVPTELLTRALQANLPIALTYGLTEAASQVATLAPEGVRDKPSSVGKPLPFTSISIVDEREDELPAGQTGQIVVHGPTVMEGYDSSSEGTTNVLSSTGLHTGDLGYLDTDGDLWVLNRREDLIISGGENVYPAQVEAVLLKHPCVQEACVVGLEDPEWGQSVAALLILSVGAVSDPHEIGAFMKNQLASYKCPRRIIFADELPKTTSGKLDRKAVVRILNKHTR